MKTTSPISMADLIVDLTSMYRAFETGKTPVDNARREMINLCRKFVTSHSSMLCRDCDQHHNDYMLKKNVWDQIRGKDRSRGLLLCVSCAEKRLRRPLAREDLQPDIPINDTIFWAFDRARRLY